MTTAARRILVTGATGYIGTAVARALADLGHDVAGTVRATAPDAAARLAEVGIAAVEIDLRDDQRLARAAGEAEVTVHCAFPSTGGDDLAAAIALERQATATLIHATRRSGGTLVYTSGVGVLAGLGSEDAVPRADAPMRWRYDIERQVADAGGRVVRPALVYGHGGNALLLDLVRQSAARGGAGYLGDGDGSLPTVHLDDLAEAYVRVVESGSAGATYTIVGGHTTAREIAQAIGHLIGAPAATCSLAAEVVQEELPSARWLAGEVAVDPVRARVELGWSPTGPSLVQEIEAGS